jgi:uncharacterized protein (DUF488 family)
MKVYTIGYGGRKPQEFLDLLTERGIRAVVDVRLRPDRSSMGIYAKAKDADKGIEALLAGAGIAYYSFIELGNIFRDMEDWQQRYRQLMDRAGDLLTQRLLDVPEPFCLLCAEKRAEQCHRKLLADYLAKNGHQVEHIA